MSLIDTSYFVKKLNIPNTDDAAINELIVAYINQYEREFLIKLFGYPLFKAYNDDKDGQRFKDILDGVEYTDINGYLNKWDGLIETLVPEIPANGNNPTIPAVKQSIIANFIYYKYRIENATQFTGIGEVTISAENTNSVSPRRRLCLVWNEMSDKVSQFIQFLEAKQDVYPEWTYVDKITALKYFSFMNPIF